MIKTVLALVMSLSINEGLLIKKEISEGYFGLPFRNFQDTTQ